MLKSVCLHMHMHVRVYFSVMCSLFCLACFIYLGKLSCASPGSRYKTTTGKSTVCAVCCVDFLAFGTFTISLYSVLQAFITILCTNILGGIVFNTFNA